jgi:hypothetical protein
MKRSTLIKKLDKIFSVWVRRKNEDHGGYVDCFTCGVTKHWKEVDAGHFQSRGKYATRWHEDNVKPQCKKCNAFRGGEQYQFALNLGSELADELVYLSNQQARLTNDELLAKIQHYSQLVASMK